MTNNINNNPKTIRPHTYPNGIKVTLFLVGLMFCYTFFLIPKILRVRDDVKLSDIYFKKADDFFKVNKFNEAIPLYKKGLYLSWEKKPEKLALCYLNQLDNNSIFNGLALLNKVKIDSTQLIEILKVLPQKYHNSISSNQILYKKKIISTTYSFDFSNLEDNDYNKILSANKEFENFIHSNPNN